MKKQILNLQKGILFLLLCAFSQHVFAQNVTVRGIVADTKGEFLIGATVYAHEINTGTVTDADGKFILPNMPPNATLEVSYVGMISQTIALNGRTALHIIMEEDAELLEEVVVVGYGTARRSDVTGAIASVQSSALSEVPSVDAAQALQGRVAGVDIQQFGFRPGADTQIRIRGTRSLTASNDPLIVVDGVTFSGNFNQIASDDIKSIDILKDASATAIYGSRGANGVIIITTYRGDATSKTQINYSGYYGLNTISKKYKLMSPEDFVTMRIRSRYQWPNQFLPQEMESLRANGDGTYDVLKSYDWQDEMYQTGAVTNHDFSIRGGNQTLQGSLGLGYYNETSTLPGPEFTRFTVRGSVDFQANKWFKIGFSTNEALNFISGENVNQVVMGDILQFSPLVNPYDEDGNIVERPIYPREDIYNPLLIKDKSLWSEDRRRFSTMNSLYAEIQFMPELRYRLNLGLNYSHQQYGTYYSSKSNQRSGALSTASISENANYNYMIDNILYYNKEFQKKHRIGATAMFSLEDSYNESVTVSGEDLLADYMKYHNLSYANQRLQVSSASLNRRVLISYMGRLNYSYDDKYILTVTGRADGTSVLSEGKKWHFYPAVSGAWNIYRESFMTSVKMVDLLKLRLGYGQTSNQAVNPYSTLGTLSRNSYFFGDNDVYGYYPSTVRNPNLGWEYTNMYNLGVDFGLWRRLSGTIDMYLQKTYDLLISQAFPASSGQSGRFLNNTGKTENKGIEFTLHSENIVPKNKDGFRWSSDLNLYRNRNKIVELPGKVERDVGNGWFVGQPIDVVYDFKKIGIWQLGEEEEIAKFNLNGHTFAPGEIKLLDVNGDYKIDADNDRVMYGTFEPDFFWGFTNRFNYKDFDLTMIMHGQFGGTLVSTLHQNSFLNFLSGRYNQLDVDYWWEDNPTNDHPKPQFLGGIRAYYSTMGYFDATFMKIRTITLGYKLPKKWLGSIGISELRVYATCNNVATLFSPYMKHGGLDPQPTGTGTQTVRGNVGGSQIQSRQMSVSLGVPPTRQFMFGLNIKL